MSWWGRLRRKSAPLSLRDPDHWRNSDSDIPAGVVVTADSALALSAVWACVNLIAGTIASLPLMVYRTEKSGRRTVDKDHPLYHVLHDSPNGLQTAGDFLEFGSASIELHGNAYARVVRNGSRVVSLMPVSPDLPVVRRINENRLEYAWSENGQSFRETTETMLHIRGFGGSPVGGLSTLAFGRKAFGLATAIDNSAGATFGNGLRPSGTLNFKEFLTKDQREIVEKRLVEKFVGSLNAGRPMVLEGGTEWRPLTINPEDAQMLESRSFSVEEICRFFGVPPHMVGHTEKATSWGTGLEQQTLGFQKFTLRRRLKRIEQALEKQLLEPEERKAGIVIEFNIEGLLRGDSAARSAFYQSGLTNGWMTINEVRALENMPPVTGGEVPRMQSQNIPITQEPANADERLRT